MEFLFVHIPSKLRVLIWISCVKNHQVAVESQAYHKTCFKCSHGGCSLSPSNYAALEGILYCKHHFSQLFKEKGSYNHLIKSASIKRAAASVPEAWTRNRFLLSIWCGFVLFVGVLSVWSLRLLLRGTNKPMVPQLVFAHLCLGILSWLTIMGLCIPAVMKMTICCPWSSKENIIRLWCFGFQLLQFNINGEIFILISYFVLHRIVLKHFWYFWQ